MVEALYYIHEMSGIAQMDDLLAAQRPAIGLSKSVRTPRRPTSP